VNGHSIKQFIVFGKPHAEPYRLMEGLLLQQAKLIGLDLPSADYKLPFGAVYAVGDNPASDIAGARAAGVSCISGMFLACSMLVHSTAVQLCYQSAVTVSSSKHTVYGPVNTSAVHAWQLKITRLLLVLPIQMLLNHVRLA